MEIKVQAVGGRSEPPTPLEETSSRKAVSFAASTEIWDPDRNSVNLSFNHRCQFWNKKETKVKRNCVTCNNESVQRVLSQTVLQLRRWLLETRLALKYIVFCQGVDSVWRKHLTTWTLHRSPGSQISSANKAICRTICVVPNFSPLLFSSHRTTMFCQCGLFCVLSVSATCFRVIWIEEFELSLDYMYSNRTLFSKQRTGFGGPTHFRFLSKTNRSPEDDCLVWCLLPGLSGESSDERCSVLWADYHLHITTCETDGRQECKLRIALGVWIPHRALDRFRCKERLHPWIWTRVTGHGKLARLPAQLFLPFSMKYKNRTRSQVDNFHWLNCCRLRGTSFFLSVFLSFVFLFRPQKFIDGRVAGHLGPAVGLKTLSIHVCVCPHFGM